MNRLLIPFLILLCSCATKTKLQYHPHKDEKAVYSFKFDFGRSSLNMEIEFGLDPATGDTLLIKTQIHKMEMMTGTTVDRELSSDYQRYVDKPLYFKMSPHGRLLQPLTWQDTETSAAEVIDIKLFFPDYPDTAISEGFSWKQERNSTDRMFKTIKTDYTFKRESAERAYLLISNDYVDPTGFMTKRLQGLYIMNSVSGLLDNVTLTIDGSSGKYPMSGMIEMKRIN